MRDQDALVFPKGLPWTEPGETILGRWLFDGTFPMPTAVLRSDPLMGNINEMARFCSDYGMQLAPHAKTTMSPQIVRRQVEAGAWGMTVATAWQASQVAAMGVGRILIANEVTDPGSLALLGTLMSRHADIKVWCWIDSPESLRLIEHLASHAGQLGLLIELGIPGGRAGVRSLQEALNLAHRVAQGPLGLSGFSGFEGIIGAGAISEALGRVDDYLNELAELTNQAWRDGLLTAASPALVSVGGSAYQDRVAVQLASRLRGLPIEVILRSGCYVTHDTKAYHCISPFGESQRLPYTLQQALEVWAPVLSTPEEGKAIAGLGRRDAGFDAGWPVPLRIMRQSADRVEEIPHGFGPPLEVVAMNDQHAYLDIASEFRLTTGDLLGFGISHPCTTFDKWGAIPIVDASDVVIDIATTRFV